MRKLASLLLFLAVLSGHGASSPFVGGLVVYGLDTFNAAGAVHYTSSWVYYAKGGFAVMNGAHPIMGTSPIARWSNGAQTITITPLDLDTDITSDAPGITTLYRYGTVRVTATGHAPVVMAAALTSTRMGSFTTYELSVANY
jgi:hypothetical protein